MENKLKRKERRKRRVALKLKKAGVCLRLSVYRSNKHLYAQIIDDREGVTLVSSSDLALKEKDKNKIKLAYEVGKDIAKKALKRGIEEVKFSRGRFSYHGQVKALASGAREGGLKF